jgi:predicted neuraminidase
MRTLLPALAAALFVVGGPACAAEAGGPVELAEFMNDPMPTPSCHATTIAEGRRGLVAAWFGGLREGDKGVGIWLARQEAGKWLPAAEVATGVQDDGTRHPCWNPVLFQPSKGPLLLFYKVGPTCDRWWGMRMTSADGGATWSAATRLPDGIIGPVKNKPVELADGTLLCGASDELGGWTAHMERTADGGATWSRTPPLNDAAAIGAIQPCLLTLRDGGILALGRTKQKKIFSLLSADQGRTWGPMALTDLPNPNSGIDAVTLKDGRHLLVYNPVPKGRSPLVVAVSDDGRAWRDVVTLEDEPKAEFSYPAVMQAADGKVHITYTWKRLKARHVVLDPAKVK